MPSTSSKLLKASENCRMIYPPPSPNYLSFAWFCLCLCLFRFLCRRRFQEQQQPGTPRTIAPGQGQQLQGLQGAIQGQGQVIGTPQAAPRGLPGMPGMTPQHMQQRHRKSMHLFTFSFLFPCMLDVCLRFTNVFVYFSSSSASCRAGQTSWTDLSHCATPAPAPAPLWGVHQVITSIITLFVVIKILITLFQL